MNLASTIAGAVVTLLVSPYLPAPSSVRQLSQTLILALAWLVSVIVEAWVLSTWARSPRRTWTAAVVANSASYMALAAVLGSMSWLRGTGAIP